MTDDVRFAILGSGNMARVYAEALRTQVTGGRLVALALGSRAASLAADYGVDAEPGTDALLGRPDLDVVVITTPHSTHRPLAEAVAAAGRHVYLEKPMALDVAECDAIIAACRRAGVHLTVAKQTRHLEMSRTAITLLRAGRIGDLRMVQAMSPLTGWGLPDDHWLNRPGEGDCFLDWGSHACDALRWMTGSEAVHVFAEYANFDRLPAVGPTAMVTIRMASGVLGQLLMSYEIPEPGLGTNSNNQYRLIGSTGIIEFDLDRVRLGTAAGWETVSELPTWIHPFEPTNPRRIGNTARQVQDVVDAIRSGQQPAITGEDGRAAIAMATAASRSAGSGRAEAPEPPTGA